MNKSVHWNQNYLGSDLLEVNHPYSSHSKNRPVAASFDTNASEKLNPVLSQTLNNINEVIDFPENTYFTGPKINALTVTPEVIIQWVRDTLEDASFLKIPGYVLNPDK